MARVHRAQRSATTQPNHMHTRHQRHRKTQQCTAANPPQLATPAPRTDPAACARAPPRPCRPAPKPRAWTPLPLRLSHWR
eukprot:365597-Chlamydomonas_euryale.AAC.4